MTNREPAPESEAFRQFLRRVWRDDISPLLQDRRAAQRKATARVVGKAAATGGLLLDSLFGLKGKPFGRFMTVVGSTVGAILPDAWDWDWLRDQASPEDRHTIEEKLRQRADALSDDEALAIFDLPATASLDDLKSAWRETALRCHPDRAASEALKSEYTIRFVAYSQAHERLKRAFDAGRLPRRC